MGTGDTSRKSSSNDVPLTSTNASRVAGIINARPASTSSEMPNADQFERVGKPAAIRASIAAP